VSVVDLAYAEQGDGRPVVLLHAFPLSRVVFDEQARGLADRARVVLPDLRGFGESPAGDDEPSLDRMADDVAALLDRLGLERVVLGGLSMGGYVVMAFLRRHPERVSAVVLMDTKAGADPPAARENRLRVAEAVLEQGPRALRPMLDALLGETTRRERPDVVDRVTAWLDAARPDGVVWAQRAMADRPDSTATLAATSQPAFCVVGEEDTLSPHEEALAMAATFPREAVVHVIPRAGHLTTVEAPGPTTGALRDVLRHV